MTADRIIAQVRSRDGYAGLMGAFRVRVAELDTTYEAVDALSGLTSRHTAKLLAPIPIRIIGRHTLGALLGALGVKLLVVEDAEAFAQISHRLDKRRLKDWRPADVTQRTKRKRKKSIQKGNSAWGEMMAARRFLKLTPEHRSAIARKGGRARQRSIRKAARAPSSTPAA